LLLCFLSSSHNQSELPKYHRTSRLDVCACFTSGIHPLKCFHPCVFGHTHTSLCLVETHSETKVVFSAQLLIAVLLGNCVHMVYCCMLLLLLLLLLLGCWPDIQLIVSDHLKADICVGLHCTLYHVQ